MTDDRKRLFVGLAIDFGKLDIVFANAGVSDRTPTGATDEATFENVIRINLNGAFFTVNSAAPLLNDGASIIFNGSVHNYLGQAGDVAKAVLFLTSEDSSYINAVELMVDGGLTGAPFGAPSLRG